MSIFGDLLSAVASVLDTLLSLYMWVVIVASLISWVNPDPRNPIVRFLHAATDPILIPIRRVVGFRMHIDISPIIVILAIIFLQALLRRFITIY